jgi:hypothetical protein
MDNPKPTNLTAQTGGEKLKRTRTIGNPKTNRIQQTVKALSKDDQVYAANRYANGGVTLVKITNEPKGKAAVKAHKKARRLERQQKG